MHDDDIVPANLFCLHHNIELSFIRSLMEYELIETVLKDENIFVPVSQLPQLEKIIRLHFELNINLEGIEAISHLLERMEGMQRQILQLSTQLKIYEKDQDAF